MSRLFGTDGVRGLIFDDLSPELAYHLGIAAASVLSDAQGDKCQVIIGKDTRMSGDMLEAALTAGFTAVGAHVDLAGIIPTPGIAYLSKKHHYDIGAVISASHNPYEFNGIKFFSSEGYKLPDAVEDRIEAVLKSFVDDPASIPLHYDRIGRTRVLKDAGKEYIEALRGLCPVDLTGYKIAIDCANGATSALAPELFAELGAQLLVIAAEPDGRNINDACGSTHPEALAELVRRQHCDIGLAFDGDADRLIAVDEKGEVLDGDYMLSMLAADLKRRGELDGNTVVVTVMSNIGMDRFAEKESIQLKKTQVGDRYVLEEMLNGGYILGGEQSGHMIFLREATTGDGMLSALHLLKALKKSGKKLSEFHQIMTKYPQLLRNVTVSNASKSQVLKDVEIAALAEKISAELEGRGRLLLRPSGTEPYVRIMLEGEDLSELERMSGALAQLITTRFGVQEAQ